MILKNVRLLSQLSSKEGIYDVKVENGKIIGIGNYNEAGIECNERTLLPGLIDAHTHISGLISYDLPSDYNAEDYYHAALNHTKKYLEYGFTTLRECGCSDIIDQVKQSGEKEFPTIIQCRRIISPSVLDDGVLTEIYAFADGKSNMMHAAVEELKNGAQYVKLMASGSAMQKSSDPLAAITSPEEVEGCVEVATEYHTYVAAHAHSDDAIRMCAEKGVKTIEHATYIGDDTIEYIKKKQGIALIPTLAAMYVSVPDESGYYTQLLGKMLDKCAISIENAYKANLILGFGTDSTPTMPQYEEGIEFRYRAERCHMKPIDILLQATVVNANILGLESKGFIGEGYDADLILLEKNPLDDFSVMYHKPDMVWKSGQQIPSCKI